MYLITQLFVWLTFFVIVTSCDSSSSTDDGTYCDGTGWVAYRDEKCYKLIKQWATRNEAKDVCAQDGSDGSIPQLATIKSVDEQTYLTELVFNASAVTINVWIGAKRIQNGNKFVWDDGSEVGEFTNWAEGRPTDEIQQSCVLMKSQYVRTETSSQGTAGQWLDVPCEMPNYIICEKLPRWSFSKLQQTLLETKKELKDSNNELERKLIHIQDNPVPIGFIYVQLSGQPEPTALWSTVQWQDVTREYAGLFFRAEGGDSAKFGTVQEGNAPRVTQVRFQWFTTDQDWGSTQLNVGGWSSGSGVYSGSWIIPDHFTHQFYTSGGEVRPRNTAMRVWKRIS